MNEQKNSKKPTTLKDVAKLAGVSAMTVSNALNNRGGLSADTHSKIMAAVRELKYTPNQVAQSLRNAKSNTIGVVMADASYYVFSELLRGVTAAASERNYNVLLANTAQNAAAEHKAIDLLLSNRIDGLILASPLAFGKKELEHLKSLNIPFVILMRTSDLAGVEYVVNDNYAGCYQTVKYLYETGSRDFFFMTIDSSSGRDRVRGYTRYLEELGLRFHDFYVDVALPQIADGYQSMKNMLKKGLRGGAICCGCDLMAVGAMDAILESGYSIPRDFRLMGYDDLEMSRYLRVPLSTVRQPFYDIGHEGFHLLQNRIDNPSSAPQASILQPQIVIRQSTEMEIPNKATDKDLAWK